MKKRKIIKERDVLKDENRILRGENWEAENSLEGTKRVVERKEQEITSLKMQLSAEQESKKSFKKVRFLGVTICTVETTN